MRGYRPWEASHLFSREILRGTLSESCLGTPCCPSYEHIYKNTHFCKGKGREGKGRERDGKGKREGKGTREGKEKGKRGGNVCDRLVQQGLRRQSIYSCSVIYY